MKRKTVLPQVSWAKKALPITFAVLMLSLSPAIAVAKEIVPDEDTVLLDHLNGITLGTAFGPLTYVNSLPNLDRAGDFAEGTHIRYDLHAWYSSGWGWGSADARGTVEAWIKPRKYGGIINFNWYATEMPPAAGYILHLSLTHEGKLFYGTWTGGDAPYPWITGVTTILLDEWTHVAVSWGPSVTKLYVNGVVDASVEANIYPAMGWYGDPYVYIYLNYWGGEDFGCIDELHISKVQRSDEEIWLHYSQAIVVHATIDIDPDSLNLKSKGKWITCYIELPKGYNVNNINVSTLRLNNTISARTRPISIGDYDGDGIPDLMVKFDRIAVINYIKSAADRPTKFSQFTLTITGKLKTGIRFEGSDTIKIC